MSDKIKVQELDTPSKKLLKGLYSEQMTPEFCRFGDVGQLLLISYKEDADNYRNMTVRPDDVWVATFPRSGTTMTQDLVWLLKNDLDFDTALNTPLTKRYIFLELKHAVARKKLETNPQKLVKLSQNVPRLSYAEVVDAASPRFIKTHSHLSLLPQNLLDAAKMIYVARDPRDVAVSYYNLNISALKDFKTFWNLFVNDLVIHSPFFAHVKAAWTVRHHPNMLFIFYEDMIMDLPSSIKRIADFLGKEVTEEQIVKLCEHLDIKNFRENESVNPKWFNQWINPAGTSFVAKGKSGAWREHFDEEMSAQAQRWMRDNLADTDLRFPDHN